jgi:hypothetical protein
LNSKSFFFVCASIALTPCAMAQATGTGGQQSGVVIQSTAKSLPIASRLQMTASQTAPQSPPGGGQRPASLNQAANMVFETAKNATEGEAGPAFAKTVSHVAATALGISSRLSTVPQQSKDKVVVQN